MIVNPCKVTGTTATGAYSGVASYIEGVLRTVRCKFTTVTTTFILTINDSDGIPIYKSDTETGEVVHQIAVPVRGIYTVVISSASADEAFTVKLDIQE